tara:strand:- start:1927 stop:2121 length:195 start_codon:yes stop_codon:yes gene_type:complete
MFISPQAYMMYYRNDIEYFEMKPIKKLYNNKNNEINIKDNKLKQDYDVKVYNFGNIKLIIEYFT